MKKTRVVVAAISTIAVALLFGSPLKADVVILQTGYIITGTVLQQDDDGILIQLDYGTYRYPPSWIKDVQKSKEVISDQTAETQRIPDWGKIISTLSKKSWASKLKQIPATVVTNGSLGDVPYISFECASSGYEINIYGDLDKPASVEIGAKHYLVSSDEAKANCVNFICSVLTSADDRKIVRSLNLTNKDLQTLDGMKFETTLPDEPDAEGGWWVSVYDANSVTNARASGAELLAITQPSDSPTRPDGMPYRTDVTAPAPVPAATPVSEPETYPRTSKETSTAGSDVYVNGYYRKNGKYVQGYYRSR